MLTAATAAWADQPPEIIEHTNQPLQQTVYGLRQIPQECTGKGTNHYVCWEVYPTAWQALNKSRKGIDLVIKLWVNNAPPAFTDCDMEVMIDRTISPIRGVHFQPGSHSFEGSTATLKDYGLVRILALANNAAFSADAKPRLVMKVTSEMLRAIYAVYNKYNSLEAPGDRLEQLNAKLSDLTQKMRDYNAQFVLASNQHCTTEVCLNQSKKLVISMMGCEQSIGAVLDEKIAFLAANRESIGAAQERSRSVQARGQLNESMKQAKALLESIDKQLAQPKASRSARP